MNAFLQYFQGKKISVTAKAKISAKFKITEDIRQRIYTMRSKCTLDTKKTTIFQFKILNKQTTLQNESIGKSFVFVIP